MSDLALQQLNLKPKEIAKASEIHSGRSLVDRRRSWQVRRVVQLLSLQVVAFGHDVVVCCRSLQGCVVDRR